jgi:REP element-mobilizing transposase RayT
MPYNSICNAKQGGDLYEMPGDRYLITDEQDIYFVAFTVVDWFDVFTRSIYKDTIVDSLNYCVAQKGWMVYCWCLMSNHLHLIASAREDARLSDTLRDFKKFTTRKVIEQIQQESESRKEWLLHHFLSAGKYDKRIKQCKFWRENNHALFFHPTETKIIDQKIDFIHCNPVAEGVVESAEDILYSSPGDYTREKGLVNIVRM